LEQAVHCALRDCLHSEGFSAPAAARVGGVVVQRAEVLIRFRRGGVPAHPHEVQTSIGRRRTEDIVDWARIAQLTPQASIAYACWSWELSELPSLTAALERLRDEVLVPYVAAFWRDPSRLDLVLKAQKKEMDRRFLARTEQQNPVRRGNPAIVGELAASG
jgi:hypothetical protein